ncbi:DUF3099 domain-containing protein [Arthrobacter castelli]|uniref:DUF3099 domain-containing protein n=1 Tax=Arthrobacter castelli TaxID=271431 RepID=UPI0004106D1A|nr:DUF3099 domain-containing protein [Arthrobacter castelli]
MSKHPHGKTGSAETVHNITDARTAHTDEMRSRMIKYSVSMGIRVVCLILVFVVSGWLQWAFIVGAIVLPYFAVIIANGGSDTSKLQHSDSLLDGPPAREVEGTGAGSADADDGTPAGDEHAGADSAYTGGQDGVVPGEVVDEDEPSGTGGTHSYGDRQEHRHTS